MKKLLFIFLILCSSKTNFAQDFYVQIKDSVTNEALENAHFVFINNEGKDVFKLSDQNGKVVNDLTLTNKVTISYIGYKTIEISINPKENKTILLTRSAFDLNEVVVTSQFTKILKKDVIYDIKTIDKETIENNGSSNLGEALNQQLSITINNGQANESAIMLNGMSGAYVKILIDDVPVEGKLNGSVDLSQILMTNIEKIEILEGPASIEYGSDALAGAINIITKKNQNQKISVGANAFYESVGKYNVSANVGLKLKGHFLNVSGGRNFFDGYSVRDTSRLKEWKPKEQYFADLSYSKNIKQFRIFYNFNYFDELITSRGELKAPYYTNAFDTYYKTQRFTNKLILSGKIKKEHYLNASIAQSYYNRKRNIYFKDLTTLTEILSPSKNDQDTTEYNNYLARLVYNNKKEGSKIQYMAGTSFQFDQIIANRVKNHKQNLLDFSVFSHVQYKPIKNLSIQPALRYGYNSKYKYPFLPSISFKYDAIENLSFRTSYSRGFRAPSLKELYLEFHFNSTINLFGSEDLGAENSHHFFLSADYFIQKNENLIRFQPKFFYNRINQMISLINRNETEWEYQNVGNFDILGFEFRTSYNFKNLNLGFNYQLLGQKNSIFEQTDFKDHYHISHQASAMVGINIQKPKVSLYLDYKYVGKKTGIYLDNENQIKNSSLSDYQILNISANKKFYKDRFSLTVGVNNLLNYNQIDLDGDMFGLSSGKDAESLYVLWGRTFFTSLNFKW